MSCFILKMNKKFLVVINAVNIKSAGGLTVTLNFLNIVKNFQEDIHLEVFCPKNCGFEEYASTNIHLNFIPKFMEFPLHRLWGDHLWLKRKIGKIHPDVVFTMGNIAIPTRHKQGVIFMWPYVIYPSEKYIWKLLSRSSFYKHKLIIKIFKMRLRYADVVFPQTKTSSSRLARYYPNIKKLQIVPMAYSVLGEEKKESERKIFFKKENNTIYLLCLTRYYPHKNVEILLKLGELLKKNKAPYKIITTIDSMQTLQAKTFVENIKILNLSDIIINLGTVPVNDVRSLYVQVDALLLPTLLESFSATYADSLFLKKPIFTSDRDFAKDVCADCAYYFDPMSAASIYNAIEDAYKNRNLMEIKLNTGFERVNNFPDWNKVADLYIEQLRKL